MKEFFQKALSNALGKIIVIIAILIVGAIIDVQILKADVKEIQINSTIERRILCKIANKIQAFEDKEDNLCLELIR